MEIDKKELEELGITDDKEKRKQFCSKYYDSRTNKIDKSLYVEWDKCFAQYYHCGVYFFFGKSEKSDINHPQNNHT